MHIGKRRRHEYIDVLQKVVLRDTVVESKLIEQTACSPFCRPIMTASDLMLGAGSLFVANLKLDSIDPQEISMTWRFRNAPKML
jgi:hypothetical protein